MQPASSDETEVTTLKPPSSRDRPAVAFRYPNPLHLRMDPVLDSIALSIYRAPVKADASTDNVVSRKMFDPDDTRVHPRRFHMVVFRRLVAGIETSTTETSCDAAPP